MAVSKTSNAYISAFVDKITKKISTKFQRLNLHFLDQAFYWDSRGYCATKPEVEKSNMVTSKRQMRVSPLPDKMSTKFPRLYTYVCGSSIPLVLVGILCDHTGSGKCIIFRKCETIRLVFW